MEEELIVMFEELANMSEQMAGGEMDSNSKGIKAERTGDDGK